MRREAPREKAAGSPNATMGGVSAALRRNNTRGVIAAAALALCGIGLVLGGMHVNRVAGFHYYVHTVEGEITIIPSLPFAVRLEQLASVRAQGDGGKRGGANDKATRPGSGVLVLLQRDRTLARKTFTPGQPIEAQGVSLQTATADAGWAFALVVRDPGGREKVVPVYPGSPAVVRLGLTRQYVSTGAVKAIETLRPGDEAGTAYAAEVFLLEKGGKKQSLGFATEKAPVSASGYMVSIWNVRRYIGLDVYRQPGRPMKVAGYVSLFAAVSVLAFLARRRRRRPEMGSGYR